MQFRDYLALAGDAVDNVPGAKGIGPKTAAQLIQQYGDIDSIMAHAHEHSLPVRVSQPGLKVCFWCLTTCIATLFLVL